MKPSLATEDRVFSASLTKPKKPQAKSRPRGYRYIVAYAKARWAEDEGSCGASVADGRALDGSLCDVNLI